MLVIWCLLFPLLIKAFKPSHPLFHKTIEGELPSFPPFTPRSSTIDSSLKFYLAPDGTLIADQDLKLHTLAIHELADVKRKQLLFVAYKDSHTVFYRSPIRGKVIQLFVENGQTVPKYFPILQFLKSIPDSEVNNGPIMPVVSESSEEDEE